MRDGAASMLAGEDFSDRCVPRSATCCGRTTTRSMTSAAGPVLVRLQARGEPAARARAGRWTSSAERVGQTDPRGAERRLAGPMGDAGVDRVLRVMLLDGSGHAFYRLTLHNDETYAEVLELVDELLAIESDRCLEPRSLRKSQCALEGDISARALNQAHSSNPESPPEADTGTAPAAGSPEGAETPSKGRARQKFRRVAACGGCLPGSRARVRADRAAQHDEPR
jgi:hypothetical protein